VPHRADPGLSHRWSIAGRMFRRSLKKAVCEIKSMFSLSRVYLRNDLSAHVIRYAGLSDDFSHNPSLVQAPPRRNSIGHVWVDFFTTQVKWPSLQHRKPSQCVCSRRNAMFFSCQILRNSSYTKQKRSTQNPSKTGNPATTMDIRSRECKPEP